MSDRHVIIGAGPVGRATAAALQQRGAEVVLASRSGRDGTTAVDATSPDALARLADGAVALYNCVNPPAYDKWPELWPPVARALLESAERSGAVLVTAANLYPYGPVPGGEMREGMPDSAPGPKAQVRAQMTAEAFAAHRAGRIRAVEVRGSDYMGAGPGDYAHVPRVVAKALRGKTVSVLGSAHQPHTWTDVRDMGRALATVAGEESAWGRVWHAPSNAPRSQAEAVNDVLASVGAKPVTVKAMPQALLTIASPFVPVVRELRETLYQFTAPYVMDSSEITATFGLEPTSWDEVCRRTAG
ncbi:NAD-dependent epimerase/dehydratase family protein [Nocardioides limicola]|uniref:NAD-dependent epimerase/dehydratase family protein n=1 Tax=Nocardioides limicola TaxID=2803368 RepID=UPI00193B4B13|nr:NAD-dependent epimerase/dehydratase family protein [Nocardioides sp. DJM-14]